MSVMASETNIFSFSEISDPVERARAALRAMQQYQQDWEEYGVDRVHKYFNDVEGDWLENFESISLPTNEPIKFDSDIVFADVFQKLQSLGLSKSFIENVVFPSWWKNEFEYDQCAISKLLKHIADRLLLKIDYLVESSTISLEFLPVFTKFKLQKKSRKSKLICLFS